MFQIVPVTTNHQIALKSPTHQTCPGSPGHPGPNGPPRRSPPRRQQHQTLRHLRRPGTEVVRRDAGLGATVKSRWTMWEAGETWREHQWRIPIYIYIYLHIYIYMYIVYNWYIGHLSYLLIGGLNPSEKYESQLGCLSSIHWKNKKCSKKKELTFHGKIFTQNQPDFPMKIMGFSCIFSRKKQSIENMDGTWRETYG